MTQPDRQPIVSLRGVAKRFGTSVVALRHVNLDIFPGKVHGLLGANGAGKSTLIKILSGLHIRSGGTILWKGAVVNWTSPKEANDHGIATIHQHIPLVPSLSVIENVFLGQRSLLRKSPLQRQKLAEICARLDYRVSPDQVVGDLRIGQRQMVAILQALSSGAEVIVMDEPTASLAAQERELVYRMVRHLAEKEGKAVIFVSHFLDEVMALTDEVSVLRDGQVALSAVTAELDETKIAEAIVGRQIVALEREHSAESAARSSRPSAPVLLEVKDLASPGKVSPLSFSLAKGEVLGIAGLLGSGRSEILNAIFGADRQASGTVKLEGAEVGRTTRAAVRAGIGLVPEDRMRLGLVRDFEIWRNTTLPAMAGVSAAGIFPIRKQERARGWAAIRKLSIRAPSPDTPVRDLSGGNAQKVTIAKWLFSNVKLLLLDEPTAGIDIGAKTDILRLVRSLAEEGTSVIVVSSEFEELLAVADRIFVIRDGRMIAERRVQDTNEHDLFLLAGGKDSKGTAGPSHPMSE